jgi:hypothetical protein
MQREALAHINKQTEFKALELWFMLANFNCDTSDDLRAPPAASRGYNQAVRKNSSDT